MREQYFVYYDDTDFIYRALKASFHKGCVLMGGMALPFTKFFINGHWTLFRIGGLGQYNRTQRLALLKGIWKGLTKLDRRV